MLGSNLPTFFVLFGAAAIVAGLLLLAGARLSRKPEPAGAKPEAALDRFPRQAALVLVACIGSTFLVPWALTLRTLPRTLFPLALLGILLVLAVLGVGLLAACRSAESSATDRIDQTDA